MTIFTIKMPDEMASDLANESQALRITKGALVREALKFYLKTKKSSLVEQIKTATHDMVKNKKIKKSLTDWQSLRKKCQSDTKLTPEQEVRLARTRGLDVL